MYNINVFFVCRYTGSIKYEKNPRELSIMITFESCAILIGNYSEEVYGWLVNAAAGRGRWRKRGIEGGKRNRCN